MDIKTSSICAGCAKIFCKGCGPKHGCPCCPKIQSKTSQLKGLIDQVCQPLNSKKQDTKVQSNHVPVRGSAGKALNLMVFPMWSQFQKKTLLNHVPWKIWKIPQGWQFTTRAPSSLAPSLSQPSQNALLNNKETAPPRGEVETRQRPQCPTYPLEHIAQAMPQMNPNDGGIPS